MSRKKILDNSFELLIIPLFFMLTEYLEIVSLNTILSILIFYFFIGYKILQTIKNSFKFEFGKYNSSTFYLIQDLSFAFLIGIVLNVIYGIIAASFQIYSHRSFYFLFFELVVLLNFYLKNRSLPYSSEVVKNYRLSDFLKLSILLLPSVIQVLISFYHSPLPLIQGWDIFYYQGITNQFLVDRIDYNLFELAIKPPGFMFIQANLVISSNIPAYFLIFFDKIAVILTNGFCTLWVFLICYKITKSDIASIIPSTALSTLDGRIGLGPYFVVPSSFSWQIGLIIFYFLLYKKKIIEDFKVKNTQKKKLYGYIFLILLLIGLCYIFHLFTFLVIIFLVIVVFVLELNHFKLRRVFYSFIIILLVIFIFFHEKIIFFNQTFQFISSIVYTFQRRQNLLWTFSQSFSFLFEDYNLLINPILGLFSIIIILIFNQKEFDFYIFNFCLFLIVFFAPLIYIYRITYLIFVFNAILQSIAIYQIKEHFPIFKEKYLRFLSKIKKSKKNNLNVIQDLIISSKKSKFKLKCFLLPFFFLLFISPIFLIATKHDYQGSLYVLHGINEETFNDDNDFYFTDIDVRNSVNFNISKLDFTSIFNETLCLDLKRSSGIGNQTILEGSESIYMEDALNSHYLHEIQILPEKISAYSFEENSSKKFLQFIMNNQDISHKDHSYTYHKMAKSISLNSDNTFMEISFRFSGNSTDLDQYFWAIYSNSSENMKIKYFLNSNLQDTWIKTNISLSELKSFQSIKFWALGDVKVDYLQIESIKLIYSNLSQYIGTINNIIHRTPLKPFSPNETLIFDQFFFTDDSIKLHLVHLNTQIRHTNSSKMTLNHGLSMRYDFESIISYDLPVDSSLTLNFASQFKGKYLEEKIVKISNNGREFDFSTSYYDSENIINIDNSKSLENGTISVYSRNFPLTLFYFSLYINLDNFVITSLVFIGCYFVISWLLEQFIKFFTTRLGLFPTKLTKNFKRIFSLLKQNDFSPFSPKRIIIRNKKLFNLHNFNSIFIFLIIISPSFFLMQENFNLHPYREIYLPTSNKIVYSAYSYEEYDAAVWLYENIDRKTYYISADPGSNYYLYSIAGIPYLNTEVKSNTYKNIFLSCGDQGLNIKFFQELEDYDYKKIILVLTPRFHKWIQTNSFQERGIVNLKWINSTLLDYIDNSPYVSRIYKNSEVYIFSFNT